MRSARLALGYLIGLPVGTLLTAPLVEPDQPPTASAAESTAESATESAAEVGATSSSPPAALEAAALRGRADLQALASAPKPLRLRAREPLLRDDPDLRPARHHAPDQRGRPLRQRARLELGRHPHLGALRRRRALRAGGAAAAPRIARRCSRPRRSSAASGSRCDRRSPTSKPRAPRWSRPKCAPGSRRRTPTRSASASARVWRPRSSAPTPRPPSSRPRPRWSASASLCSLAELALRQALGRGPQSGPEPPGDTSPATANGGVMAAAIRVGGRGGAQRRWAPADARHARRSLLATAFLPGCGSRRAVSLRAARAAPAARPAPWRAPAHGVPGRGRAGRGAARRVRGHRGRLGRGVRAVQVTARVAGVVERVRFREGDTVGPAQVLAEIEPAALRAGGRRRREAALAQGRGRRGARPQAGLARREQAVNAKNPGLIPGEELDDLPHPACGRRRPRSPRRKRRARAGASSTCATPTCARRSAGIIQTRTVADRPVRAARHRARHAGAPRAAAAALPGAGAGRGAAAAGHARRASRCAATRAATRRAITHVAAAADEASRMVTVTARGRRPERGRALRPGAFAEVTVPVGDGERRAGDPADRGAPERARLPRLRGRGRQGARARARARPAHGRRPGRGARRA